jgi:hypothetical protein
MVIGVHRTPLSYYNRAVNIGEGAVLTAETCHDVIRPTLQTL